MSYRNFLQLQSEVYAGINVFKEKIPPYEVQQTLNDALLEICQFHDWNFLIDRYDVGLVPSYATGTVSLTYGSTALTGTGTAFDTGWFNKKILLGGTQNIAQASGVGGAGSDKEIAFFSSATSGTLRYQWNYPSVTNVAFFIYQDEYPVPMQNGRDIAVINPIAKWRLKKPDRYTLEDRTVWGKFTNGVQPTHYSDAGADVQPTSPTYNQAKLKFWPIPNVEQDLFLYYYKTPTPLINDTDTTVLPNEFEEVLIRLTLYRVKKRIGSPGWMDDQTYAMRQLLQFREKQNIQPSYDYQIQFSMVPFFDSFSNDMAWGGVWPGTIR